MTGEERYTKVEGLLYYERFYQEIIDKYASKSADRQAYQEMKETNYKGSTTTFLLAMQNLNMRVQL